MSNINAVQAKYNSVRKLEGSSAQIFPLLCPVREMEWIDGWEYEWIFSKSGLIEPGCIFKTQKAYGMEVIWTVAEHDAANYRIHFVNYAKDLMVIEFRIHLFPQSETLTDALFSYTLTGITASGNQVVGGFTEEKFNQMVTRLEQNMNYYLTNGIMLKVR